MRSVADDLRDELQEEALRLSFEERVALVLRLGERGLEMFRQANGLDRETAIRELQRQRQAGRTPSHPLEVHVRADRMSLLEEIISTLEAAGIRHALIGALALSVYGVNRASVDLGAHGHGGEATAWPRSGTVSSTLSEQVSRRVARVTVLVMLVTGAGR
jgi:hypothetical protein